MYCTPFGLWVCMISIHLLVCSLSSDFELLKSILELIVIRGDLEFLKYLIDNQSVDVNGKLEKQSQQRRYDMYGSFTVHRRKSFVFPLLA